MTTHNYQQLKNNNNKNQPKKQTQTKETTRTGRESQKWRSHGGLSVSGRGESEGKVKGIRSINGRHKTHRGRLRIVWEMEKLMNFRV